MERERVFACAFHSSQRSRGLGARTRKRTPLRERFSRFTIGRFPPSTAPPPLNQPTPRSRQHSQPPSSTDRSRRQAATRRILASRKPAYECGFSVTHRFRESLLRSYKRRDEGPPPLEKSLRFQASSPVRNSALLSSGSECPRAFAVRRPYAAHEFCHSRPHRPSTRSAERAAGPRSRRSRPRPAGR
jgi:hypothetical protein